MATLSFCMASSVKVVAASKVSKKSAPKEESKNFFQFLTDAFARDQLFENDPGLCQFPETNIFASTYQTNLIQS